METLRQKIECSTSYWRKSLRGLLGYQEYFAFPFDHNKAMPEGAERVLAHACDLLSRLRVKFFVADGTALGIFRNGRLIPHDNDIDVDVIGEINFEDLDREFKKLGMTLGRRVSYQGRLQQIIYYSPEEIIFDIVFWYSNGSTVTNRAEFGFVRTQSARFFGEPEYVEFCGVRYPFHAPLREWIVARYGTNWNVPQKQKNDWKIECADIRPTFIGWIRNKLPPIIGRNLL